MRGSNAGGVPAGIKINSNRNDKNVNGEILYEREGRPEEGRFEVIPLSKEIREHQGRDERGEGGSDRALRRKGLPRPTILKL